MSSETWYPLGYNIRPRRLHTIAREAVGKYGGHLPDDESMLRSFKGIGPYTAGAVMSFAFGKRAAILDTNVARVLFRVFVGARQPGPGRHENAATPCTAPGDGQAPVEDLLRGAAAAAPCSTSIRR